MSGTVRSKAAALTQLQGLIAGVQKHFPKSTFKLGNATLTSAALISLLQGVVTALQASDAARAAFKNALSTQAETKANAKPITQALIHLVRATFGSDTESLADFGLQPPKPRRKLTSDEKAAAAAKASATRKLRNTLGPRQKAAIKAPPVALKP